MRIHHALFGLLLCAPALAQNPVLVDPAHFRLEYEDDRVRLLRFRLAPGEKSPLHEHNTRISVVVSGSRLQIEDTEGASHIITVNSGQAERQPATRHSVENLGDTVYEELTTEFKDKASEPPKLVVKAPPPPPKVRAKQEKPKPEKPAKAEKQKPAAEPVVSATAPAPAPSPAKEPPKAAPTEVAKAAPPEKVEPPPPPQPEPIIKPLKKRTEVEAPKSKRARKAFEAEELSEASVNGAKLAFMEQGSGVPVVFVHGAMGDYRSWQMQIAPVARTYHVIAYSRRYHYPNPSTGKEQDYSYAANVQDLADFLAALKLGPVHLVGHGYGAAVAALLAEEHPDLVRSLTLSEPGFDKLLDEKRAYISHWARDEVYNIIRKPLSKANPEKGVQVYHDWLAETEPWSRLDPQEQYERKQNANALRAQSQDPASPPFTCDDAKRIAAPTLVIAGQNRSPNSAEITGTLAACLPKSERVTISNTGPAAFLDNPQEYNDALLKFLAKH